MRTPLAWRNVLHEKVRLGIGVAGIGFAIMLVFLQLGFYGACVVGATLVFDHLDFDVVVVSSNYSFMLSPQVFPRRRVHQALNHPAVESSVPFYVGGARWKNGETGILYSALVFGVRPDKRVFRVDSINRHAEALQEMDTAIVDQDTRPRYGDRHRNARIEVNGRDIRILDQYKLGTAFIAQGILIVSDQNFVRLVPSMTLDEVTLGLVRLRESADPEEVARQLRQIMPKDVEIFTREELRRREQRHWIRLTSTGFIFGSGVLVAFVVGTVILYQTVSAQFTHRLSEYATLKAMGYGSGTILKLALQQATIYALLGFLPGFAAALYLYRGLQKTAYLPMSMPAERVLFVLGLALVMSFFSGLLAFRKVRDADPADLF